MKSDDGVYVYSGSLYFTTNVGKVFKLRGNPGSLHLELTPKLPGDAIPLKRPLTARDWDADDYLAVTDMCITLNFMSTAAEFRQMWKHTKCDDELNALAEKLYSVAGGETLPFDGRTIFVQNEWRAKARHWQEINK